MTRLRLLSSAMPMAAVLAAATLAGAQTPIERHSNRFSPGDDVKLGQQAASEIRQQMPLLDDEQTEAFIQRIGERLIDEIPSDYRQPEFRYSFDVVNLREINAFALPGGPMFVNRGMIQAARSEGEIAGVMAHELAHVVLRHGTVQATRGQKLQLGAMAGQILGSILGGRTGAIVSQGSEIGFGSVFLKFSREFEREADLFGAQIMARAGYDPRAMASMFETIEKQGGNRGPEWFSSHPNPGNRVQAINREASMLRVDGVAPAGDLRALHARLERMPAAPTAEQAARSRQAQQRTGRPTGTSSRPTIRVEPPSSRWRTHQPGDFLRVSVPENWEAIEAAGAIRYAPDGGVVRAENGASAFTHGIEIGVTRVEGGGSLQQQTERLVRSFARSNPQLRRESGYSRTPIGDRTGLTTTLSNVSDVTGDTEAVVVSTTQLRDGSLLFLIGVAPASEAQTYASTFSRVRSTLQLADR